MAGFSHGDGVEKLLETIERSQFGFDSTVQGPFGTKRVIYSDYTASGKPLTFIEDFIRDNVLSCYANTHTTTSITSRQTTYFREETDHPQRRECLREGQCDICRHGGCTGAVHNLIHCLKLTTLPTIPVVFVSPFEHHSNLLPWREIGAEVVWINQNEYGQADIVDLEAKLKHYFPSGRKLIGALNAASNITGVLTDTNAFSALLHKYSALALWDFATSAPYVEIDMNPIVVGADKDLVYKDAVYFSMHKFVGGVDSPGILVAKKHLLENHTPHSCGGGTVFLAAQELIFPNLYHSLLAAMKPLMARGLEGRRPGKVKCDTDRRRSGNLETDCDMDKRGSDNLETDCSDMDRRGSDNLETDCSDMDKRESGNVRTAN